MTFLVGAGSTDDGRGLGAREDAARWSHLRRVRVFPDDVSLDDVARVELSADPSDN